MRYYNQCAKLWIYIYLIIYPGLQSETTTPDTEVCCSVLYKGLLRVCLVTEPQFCCAREMRGLRVAAVWCLPLRGLT